MFEDNKTAYFSADRPITKESEDRFSRGRFAGALVQQITEAPRDESFVIGLNGPWGSGKTSVLNLVEANLSKSSDFKVLKFNPWLFSGTEQLVGAFFHEIAEQLKLKSDNSLKKVGDVLEEYCDLLSPIGYVPVAGQGFSYVLGAGKGLGKFFNWKASKKGTSLMDKKHQIEVVLKKTNFRFVVIIDDIDRLEQNEVREIMRLVRLVGDFPNITYLLAFDRPTVEAFLEEKGSTGRAYLEKIIQVNFDLPILRESDLVQFLAKGIEDILNSVGAIVTDNQELVNVFHICIKDLFNTPRDVKRYLNSLPAAFNTLGREVNPIDILALEAIRVLLPNTFVFLSQAMGALTTVRDGSFRDDSSEREKQKRDFETLLSLAAEKSDCLKHLCGRIFPASERFISNTYYATSSQMKWRRECRVAHFAVLAFYLEKSLPEGVLPFEVVQNAVDSMSDLEKWSAILNSLDGSQLEILLERLEVYEETFAPEIVVPAVIGILENSGRLREGRKEMWDFGAGIKVGRITLRLLKSIPSAEECEVAVNAILEKTSSLTWRWELIGIVGHISGLGHKLVTPEVATRYEQNFREEIVNSEAEVLSNERDLLRLISFALQGSDDQKQKILAKFNQDSFFLRFLAKSVKQVMSQSMRDVASKVRDALPWKFIVEIFGEESLKKRVEHLKHKSYVNDQERLALTLAEKYLSGELNEDAWTGKAKD